jgi:hypothetical protein
MMSVEQPVECLAGETEVLGDNLLECGFVHHKAHLGSNPGRSDFQHKLLINTELFSL